MLMLTLQLNDDFWVQLQARCVLEAHLECWCTHRVDPGLGCPLPASRARVAPAPETEGRDPRQSSPGLTATERARGESGAVSRRYAPWLRMSDLRACGRKHREWDG